MTYCRFSSSDHNCDVYVYESKGGWVTHVGRARHVSDAGPIPPTPPGWHNLEPSAMLAFIRDQERWLEGAKLQPIGLPEDGEAHIDSSPGECANRLHALREMGYLVPQFAIDNLRGEQAEMDQEVGN
ncbi:MAG: hypothetical protein Q7V53_02885 [Caldisericota bacterium]|nr:hypothetical protein [Caldisericota bacterium]